MSNSSSIGARHPVSAPARRFLLALLAFLLLASPAAAKSVRIGFFLSKGFCEFSPDGQRSGIFPDLLSAIAKEGGWQIEWVNCSYALGLKMLAKGSIDLLPGITPDAIEDSQCTFVPRSVFFCMPRLLVHEQSAISSPEQLDGALIGLVDGYFSVNRVLKSYLALKNVSPRFHSYASGEALLRDFEAGRLDAILADAILPNEHERPLVDFVTQPVYIGVSSLQRNLAPEIDALCSRILSRDSDFLRNLRARYADPDAAETAPFDVTSDPDLAHAISRMGLADPTPSPLQNSILFRRILIAVLAVLALLALFILRFRRVILAAQAGARAKSAFLATMSHEIRTPLNAIIGFSEFITDENVSSSESREYARGISKSAHVLLDLINDILDLSKLEAGQMKVLDGSCDVSALFAELASVFNARARKKSLDFSCEAPGVPPLAIRSTCLRQILLNLLGNAIKFTHSGFIACKASVAEDSPSTLSLVIVVRDSGCGIPDDKISTLFDPFVQAESSTRNRVYQGTGLGLAIVQRLVSAAGGSVQVRSKLGKGTAFIVRIPALKPLPATRMPQTPAPDSLPIPHPDFSPLSVVAVDDMPINIKVLSSHLRRCGISDIRTATSAADALDLLRQRPADFLLTDIWMPSMNGSQLAAAVRSSPPLASIKIVAVTADTESSDIASSYLFDAILFKPVSGAKISTLFANLCAVRANTSSTQEH